jgi:ABC-type lipoprotein release transport system permease subunit
MWKVTIKGLVAHKLRLALTALAIVLGVTFVSGTYVLTDTLHSTFTSLFGHVYQNVSFEIRGKAAFSSSSGAGVDSTADRKPVPEGIAAAVSQVPGVEYVDGSVSGYAQFVAPDGKAISTGGAPTLGFSFDPYPQLSSLRLVAGRAPTGPHDVVIDEGTAKKYHFEVGDRVRMLLAGPPETFTVTGIVTFGTADNLAGATLAAFDLSTAQVIFDSRGHYDTINILAKPGVNKARLQTEIAKVLPPGVEVVTGQTVANEQTSTINSDLSFFSTALLVFAFISLFVGGFTIFNTFSITVGQRTRELALLRIVGANRRQVFGSVLGEAALVGLVSSLVGLGLGVLAALGLERVRHHIAVRPVGVRGSHSGGRHRRGRRGDRGLGHQPGPARRAHPAGGGAGPPPRRRGGAVAAQGDHRRCRRHRWRCLPIGRPGGPGHRAGGLGRARGVHRCRHAGPHRGPSHVERPRAPAGRPPRHRREVGTGELHAQPAPHRPDLGCSYGRVGPGVRHRRLRRLAVQIGYGQRRQRHQRRLHNHQLEFGGGRVQ